MINSGNDSDSDRRHRARELTHERFSLESDASRDLRQYGLLEQELKKIKREYNQQGMVIREKEKALKDLEQKMAEREKEISRIKKEENTLH